MGGQGNFLHYPGESAPGPRSLPGHRTMCTKDEEQLNSWVHLCFPQTTLGSSLGWVIKKRTRGRWSSLRQYGFREHPLLRTEVSTLKEELSRPKPQEGLGRVALAGHTAGSPLTQKRGPRCDSISQAHIPLSMTLLQYPGLSSKENQFVLLVLH